MPLPTPPRPGESAVAIRRRGNPQRLVDADATHEQGKYPKKVESATKSDQVLKRPSDLLVLGMCTAPLSLSGVQISFWRVSVSLLKQRGELGGRRWD